MADHSDFMPGDIVQNTTIGTMYEVVARPMPLHGRSGHRMIVTKGDRRYSVVDPADFVLFRRSA